MPVWNRFPPNPYCQPPAPAPAAPEALALDDDLMIQTILAEVVATSVDPTSDLALLTPQAWSQWERWRGKSAIWQELPALYFKRSMIDVLLGERFRSKVDLTQAAGVSLKLSQMAAALQAMYDAVQAEILRIEVKASRSRAGATGQMRGARIPGFRPGVRPNPFDAVDAQPYEWREGNG